jgi:hypothetical protein
VPTGDGLSDAGEADPRKAGSVSWTTRPAPTWRMARGARPADGAGLRAKDDESVFVRASDGRAFTDDGPVFACEDGRPADAYGECGLIVPRTSATVDGASASDDAVSAKEPLVCACDDDGGATLVRNR